MKVKQKFFTNYWVIFLPIFIISVIIVFAFKTNGDYGDENRYIFYAQNILKGFYSPPPPDIDLGNGPGYPLLISPLIALNAPLVLISFLNAVFFYVSVVILFKLLKMYVSTVLALVASIFWALYINVYEGMPRILPEVFSVFLVILTMWYALYAFKNKNLKYLFITGFLLGFLALTKPVFGYVTIVLIIGSFILWVANLQVVNYRKAFIIASLALLTNAPFLYYTYNLTGKMFYWSSFGGNNLYWMTSPHHGEYGSWGCLDHIHSDTSLMVGGSAVFQKQFINNHLQAIEATENLTGVELDEAFKSLAIENIKSHPKKFMLNCISNVGRMIFNFPYSYKFQTTKTLLRIPFSGILVLLSLFSMIITFLNWRKIPFHIRFFLFFSIVYFGGSIFGSAETRMFTLIVPFLIVWNTIILHHSIKIKTSINFEPLNK